MEFVVGKNTYISVDEADSIINEVYFEDEDEYKIWQALDEAGKQRLILRGTKLIDRLPFLGIQYPGYQSMRWPRLIQYQYVDCPHDVKIAIIKQALKEKIHHATEEHRLQDLGVKSYSIKGASISFGSSSGSGNGTTGVKLSNGVYSEIFNEYLVRWCY